MTEIQCFECGSSFKKSSSGDSGGRFGKWGNSFCTKCLTWKKRNKWELGRSNLLERILKDEKIPLGIPIGKVFSCPWYVFWNIFCYMKVETKYIFYLKKVFVCIYLFIRVERFHRREYSMDIGFAVRDLCHESWVPDAFTPFITTRAFTPRPPQLSVLRRDTLCSCVRGATLTSS